MAEPAANQPLFYKKVVPLTRERHGEWFIQPEDGFYFTRETNCVYVAGVEFPLIAKEYPIVFAAGEDDSIVPVALLGLQDGNNLFLDDKGQWQAPYVPAYVRRYPFILAADPQGVNFTVCIDESYTGFNTAREGERLLDAEGKHGPLLERSVEFLKEYQGHVQITVAFCKRLSELQILEGAQANVRTDSGESFSLSGFKCVNREKFKALDGDDFSELVKSDYMDLIYAHLHSMANLQLLVNRLKVAKRDTA